MTVSVNGRALPIDGYPAHTTLLDLIRAHRLTGAKEGCAEGECGACTVAMVRPAARGSAYVPVNSCLLLLPMCAGQEIVTVEALAGTPAAQSMAAAGGSQCGYCTPGFVVSMFSAHYSKGACDPHDLGGNLCRCTGYRPIADAARSLGAPPPGPLLDRLSKPAPPPAGPTTLHDCFDLMDLHPAARLVAGATDLAVESNLKLRHYPCLICLEGIPELRDFTESSDSIEIGAARPLSEIDIPHPVWREWTDLFASPLIRNRATLGGNLATASPIGDGAPLLLALDARLRLASASGERVLPLHEFFLDYRKTALAPGELIRSVLLPKPLPRVARFYKVAKRRLDDISTVSAAIAIHADGSARLAYGGVAPTPIRVREAEPFLATGDIARVEQILAATLKPISDHRGSAAYRLALSQTLAARFPL